MKKILVVNEIKTIFKIENNIFIRGFEKSIFFENEIFVDNKYHLFNSNNKVFKYKDDDLFIFNESSKKFDYSFGNSNDLCCSDTNKNEFLVFNKFDNSILYVKNLKEEGKFNFEKNISHFFNDLLICLSGFSLSKLNIVEVYTLTDFKNILWSYTLLEGFTIHLKPEAIESILYFTAYDENNNNQLLTGLDIETGEVVWQNKYEITSEHKFIQATAFNEKDQLYYGFYDTYQIFNPKTGELIFEKEIPETIKYKLEPYVNAIYDDKLWFVSGRGLNKKFGCININAQQVEFIQDFPQEEDEFFDAPVYHEEKLYLRGKHFNNLYVFDK